MDISFFLIQVFGLYFLVTGLALFARQKTLTFVVKDMVKSPAVMWLAGVFAFVLGLVVVLTNNVWTWELSGEFVLTLLGWAILVEGIAYLFLPQQTLKRVVKFFNKPMWLRLFSALSVLLGGYLVYVGFIA